MTLERARDRWLRSLNEDVTALTERSFLSGNLTDAKVDGVS